MTRKFFAIALTATLLIAQSQIALAQDITGQQTWAAVQAVSPGDELRVEMKNNEIVKGRLSSVSDTTLTLSRRNKSTDLDRVNVRRVYRIGGRSRMKSAAIGAGIGGAAGVGAGLGIYLPAKDDIVGVIVPTLGAFGAGIGAAVGALVGRGQKRVLIYESR